MIGFLLWLLLLVLCWPLAWLALLLYPIVWLLLLPSGWWDSRSRECSRCCGR